MPKIEALGIQPGHNHWVADVTAMKGLKISAGARLDYYSNLPKFEFLPAFNPRLAFILKPYDGGNTKINTALSFSFLIFSPPATSKSITTSLPLASFSSTMSRRVP